MLIMRQRLFEFEFLNWERLCKCFCGESVTRVKKSGNFNEFGWSGLVIFEHGFHLYQKFSIRLF